MNDRPTQRHFLVYLVASSRPSSRGNGKQQLSYAWAQGHRSTYLPVVLRPKDTIQFVLAANPVDGWPRDQLVKIDTNFLASLKVTSHELQDRKKSEKPLKKTRDASTRWDGGALSLGVWTVRETEKKLSWSVRLTVQATPVLPQGSGPQTYTVDPEMVVGNWET